MTQDRASSTSDTSTPVEPDRSTLLLGIMSYLQQTPKLLEYFAVLHPEIDDIDDHIDTEYQTFVDEVQKLYKANPDVFPAPPLIDSDTYIQYGQTAVGRGVSRNVFMQTFQEEVLQDIELLPPCIRESWSLHEGTLPTEIFYDRYYVLATWRNNSCAPDAVLFAGIYSKIAIQQVDAVPLSQLRKLSLVQRKFREIMCLPWGRMLQHERDEARDTWRKLSLEDAIDKKVRTFDTTKPKDHPSNMTQDVRDVVEQCFADLPSFSCTVAPAITCCDRSYRIRRGCKPITYGAFYLTFGDTSTVKQKLGDIFRKESARGVKEFPPSLQKPCKRKCKKLYTRVTVVLDRLPPMLAVLVGGEVRVSRARKDTFFDNMSITYWTVTGRHVKRYIVVGVIFCVGTTQDHFVCRYRGRGKYRGQIVHYDSLQSPEVVPVATWTTGRVSSDTIRVVFYRQHETALPMRI